MLNVVWGKPIQGKEAFCFIKGFPGTFLLTERRAIVVGEFTEKQGWFQKKKFHRICMEASLEHVKDFQINLLPKERIFTGFIAFHPHGDLQEGTIIQFMKMDPAIGRAIEEHLSNLKIHKPLEDSGIILIDDDAPKPENWLVQRYGKF